MEFTAANVHPEVTKARRFLAKKIRAHLGELSREDSVALYRFLCWNVNEEAA